MIRTLVALLLLGLDQAAHPTAFEVASLKPSAPAATHMTSISPYGGSQFTARNVTLELLICMAFEVQDSQISGLPTWAQSGFYDLAAKPEGKEPVTYEGLKPLMQTLLTERFHLVIHHSSKEVRGFQLVAAATGSKLTAASGKPGPSYILPDAVVGSNIPIGSLAGMLTRVLHAPVVDNTGITGNYDFHLEYAPETSTDSTKPSIFTALKEQLGLRLEGHTVPLDVLVIDHIEKLTDAN